MEYVLLGMIIIIIAVGLYFARSSQDYIDEQNARYLETKENRSKYRALDKLEKRITTLEKGI